MTVSAARRLARFVVALELDDVPAAVVERAGLLALDTLGCCLAASRYDFGRAARATAERLGGKPESTVIGSAVRVAAANAVLANSTLAHGLDFDDTPPMSAILMASSLRSLRLSSSIVRGVSTYCLARPAARRRSWGCRHRDKAAW